MADKLLDLILEEPFLLDGSVIFTTRMRIARNIKKYPFPHQMSEKQAEKLVEEVIDTVNEVINDTCLVIYMVETEGIVRRLMLERHIISSEFAEDGFGKTLIWLPSSGLRILVNEEDHLRICYYRPCKNSTNVLGILDGFDDKLSEKLEYAFDREFGYLTSCPTNLGSGLRVSSIAFLPALKATGRIKKIFDTVYRLGYIIRGFYGEGSSSIANFYQIASGNVLGKTENEICESFDAVIGAIEQQETESITLVNVASVRRNIKIFMDKIFDNTSKGISLEQAMNGISLLLFGKKLGIIPMEEYLLRRLIYRIMPASLQIEAGMHLKEECEKILRLKLLEKELGSVYV